MADDGALVVSGIGAARGKGVAWSMDTSRFTPGTYTLGMDAAVGPDWYPAVWYGGVPYSGARRLGYIATGGVSVDFTLTQEQIDAGLWFGVARFTSGAATFEPITVRAMLQPADRSSPWERPDDTDAVVEWSPTPTQADMPDTQDPSAS